MRKAKKLRSLGSLQLKNPSSHAKTNHPQTEASQKRMRLKPPLRSWDLAHAPKPSQQESEQPPWLEHRQLVFSVTETDPTPGTVAAASGPERVATQRKVSYLQAGDRQIRNKNREQAETLVLNHISTSQKQN
jgi:hypothetical protein